MFNGWSDNAIRGYVLMLEETFMSGPSKPTYEQKVIEAKQELAKRDYQRTVAKQQAEAEARAVVLAAPQEVLAGSK